MCLFFTFPDGGSDLCAMLKFGAVCFTLLVLGGSQIKKKCFLSSSPAGIHWKPFYLATQHYTQMTAAGLGGKIVFKCDVCT